LQQVTHPGSQKLGVLLTSTCLLLPSRGTHAAWPAFQAIALNACGLLASLAMDCLHRRLYYQRAARSILSKRLINSLHSQSGKAEDDHDNGLLLSSMFHKHQKLS